MFDLEVDYECVKELLVEMAEEFDILGYPKVLEDFEGSGQIGKAVHSPRDERAIRVIHTYMKGIAKELLSEEAMLVGQLKKAPYLKGNPQFSKKCQNVLMSKKILEETFQDLKKCFQEPEVLKGKAATSQAMMPTRKPVKALPAHGALQRMR